MNAEQSQATAERQKPFFSPTSWALIFTGLSVLPAFLMTGSSAAGEFKYLLPTLFYLGLLLACIAPWFSPKPVLTRFLLTFACGVAWLALCLVTMTIAFCMNGMLPGGI